MEGLFLFGVLGIGYLCGLFPSGPWVAHSSLGRRALTDVGSGSTGATNVLRYAGWGRAVAVVLLDVVKAVAAILLARYAEGLFVLRFGDADFLSWSAPCAAIGCLLGHCFPVWSRGWRGGKGVASTMGVLLMLAPWVLLVSVVLWLGILWRWGFASLASLGTSVFLVVAAVVGFLEGEAAWGIVVIVVIVVWRHRENMGRLWRGEERRVFGERRRE